MQREIKIQDHIITYTLRISSRAKRVRLSMYSEGLTVTIPKLSFLPQAEKFILEKSQWVLRKLQQRKTSTSTIPLAEGSYKTHKVIALDLALRRLRYFNQHYGFKYNKVTIRNQKTRWGSCSRKGNLNFSYKIALIPSELADYVIVHELCHLKEFNHSVNFWNLVAQTVPEYKTYRKKLKGVG